MIVYGTYVAVLDQMLSSIWVFVQWSLDSIRRARYMSKSLPQTL